VETTCSRDAPGCHQQFLSAHLCAIVEVDNAHPGCVACHPDRHAPWTSQMGLAPDERDPLVRISLDLW